VGTPEKDWKRPPEIGVCAVEEPTPSQDTHSHLLDEWSEESSIAQSRSLDPLTPIGEDLLKTIADVAVERATAVGADLIRDKLSTVLCNGLTEEALWKAYSQRPEIVALLHDSTGPDDSKAFFTPLLPRTCNAVYGVRIQELAATSKLIERALGVDLTNIAFRSIKGDSLFSSDLNQELFPLVDGIQQITLALLEGRSVSSERDAQLLLLRLGEVGLPTAKGEQWRSALEMGMSVLVQCVHQGPCNADRLSRMLDDELVSLDPTDAPTYVTALRAWPELRSILARSVDVLKPPPGVGPRATAKAAFNVVFDVLDHLASTAAQEALAALTIPAKQLTDLRSTLDATEANLQTLLGADCHAARGIAVHCRPLPPLLASDSNAADGTRQAFRKVQSELMTLREVVGQRRKVEDILRVGRTLTNAILDEDTSEAVIESSSFLADLLGDAYSAVCETDAGCDHRVPLTEAQLSKTFVMLGALVSYASTYAGNKTDSQGTTAEVAKQRADQRKKAMEEFIDAATDRRNRSGDRIFSAGVAVSMGAVRSSSSDAPAFWQPLLSLPLGAAFQRLPGEYNVGFHAQAQAFDLGQYLATQSGATLDRRIGTALFFGGTVGILIGNSKASALVGVEGGYAPELTWHTNTTQQAGSSNGSASKTVTGFSRLGLILGTYVPFFDFN
jgi:hypothetical protein